MWAVLGLELPLIPNSAESFQRVSMLTSLSLPPEVWSLTLRNFRDLRSQNELVYLWTTVRHVCRQFKIEVEDIFRMEHLPKTFLLGNNYVHDQDCNGRSAPPTDPQYRYDSSCRFAFDGVHSTYPTRAVFSIYQKQFGSKVVREIIKDIETRTGPGRMGEADKNRPGSRVRLFENTAGLAVVQIRGGLHDCMLPSLTMERGKQAMSLDWRDLFTRFFGEKRMMDRVLKNAAVSDITVAS